jgi:hypothetical protein
MTAVLTKKSKQTASPKQPKIISSASKPKRASKFVQPTLPMPAQSTEASCRPSTKDAKPQTQASDATQSTTCPPVNGSVSDQSDRATLYAAVAPDLIIKMRELQAQRVAIIRSQLRLKLQALSLVRRVMGWRWEMDEKERTRINKHAAEVVDAIEGGHISQDTQLEIAPIVAPFVLALQKAREPIDSLRKEYEKEMVVCAKSLPVYSWIESINGLGAMGLAIIVGECGDLGSYSNPGKLWKRCGVAPDHCYAMECKDGREAIAKPKRRRSAIWTVSDSLLKAKNKYKTLDDERKVYELARAPEMTKMHAHRRAQRYAEKRMLKDLWIAWRGQVEFDNPYLHASTRGPIEPATQEMPAV